MFDGPPLPLSPHTPISQLLSLAGPSGVFGVWIRARIHRLHIYDVNRRRLCSLLVSHDLGYLLGRCSRVALREGERTRVLPADMVIHWRALQVSTALPHLPGIESLLAEFPDLESSVTELLIPLGFSSPEEVLARCSGQGVRITGSRIVYMRSKNLRERAEDPS